MERLAIPTAALAALALAACAEDAALPGAATLTAGEVETVAPGLEAVSAAAVDGRLGAVFFDGSLSATTVSVDFSVVRDCPLGGTVALAGTAVVTRDHATRSASREVDATRTEDGCAFRGRGGATLTLDGAPNTAITLTQGIVDGVPQPRVLTQEGAFDWTRSTGESGTCEIDLVSTLDPATRTLTAEGRICDRTVSITRTRSG